MVFITQRLKMRTGDDDDLLGMSIQPDGELLQGLLHTGILCVAVCVRVCACVCVP